MSISLKNLKSSTSTLPPRILIHAVEGAGKTSLAAEFPDPIYIHTAGEATPAGIDIPAGEVTSYQDFAGILGELANEPHEFKTLIIDAIDGLEPLVWAETCLRNGGWESIESPGFGKGYVATDVVWREVIAGCDYLRRERNMTIILIGHSDRVVFEDPGSQPYRRYDLRLHKRAQAIVCDWSDAILFVNSKTQIKEIKKGANVQSVHAEGGGQRWIYTDARPAFVAKNRAANMPAQIMYAKGQGFKALAPHIFPAMTPAATEEPPSKQAA